jgi:hypothetical protein
MFSVAENYRAAPSTINEAAEEHHSRGLAPDQRRKGLSMEFPPVFLQLNAELQFRQSVFLRKPA